MKLNVKPKIILNVKPKMKNEVIISYWNEDIIKVEWLTKIGQDYIKKVVADNSDILLPTSLVSSDANVCCFGISKDYYLEEVVQAIELQAPDDVTVIYNKGN
ncbi:MAG: hypothetical protein KME47_09860 [Nodosilinea sp. WJT8-NPBG4]|jgi:hypothetical protein|nr:hypothetical protein [Nodosilinea sp. WJT8-NPBG4]